MFQFQLSFKPCMVNEEHVRQCRRMLLPDVDMAVEFRCRSWFTGAYSVSVVGGGRRHDMSRIGTPHEFAGRMCHSGELTTVWLSSP